MSILAIPTRRWSHPCAVFMPSTKGSPRWCATCSFSRHVHKRRHAVERDETRECPTCKAPAGVKCTPVIKGDR